MAVSKALVVVIAMLAESLAAEGLVFPATGSFLTVCTCP